MPPKSKISREEQLVAQAVEVFSSDGYRETGLQEIADRLGITRPLFYYYFESKDDLLWRIIGHLGDNLLENARPIASSGEPPAVTLERLIAAHAQALLSNVNAFRIYFAERHQLDGKRDRRLKRGETAYQDLITEAISNGQATGEFREGDPRILARCLTGMANSLTNWYAEAGALSASELSQFVAELSVSSLRCSPAGTAEA